MTAKRKATARDAVAPPKKHELAPTLAGDGAGRGAAGRESPAVQHPPVGPLPSAARLLCSALLWADTRTVLDVARLVHPDDLDEPHRTLFAAVVACAHAGQAGPELALDRIVRDGDGSAAVRDELTQAATAGGRAEQVSGYCAAVLSRRFRAAAESYGRGVIGWAAYGSESELWHGITSGGAALRRLADRVAAARGGEL